MALDFEYFSPTLHHPVFPKRKPCFGWLSDDENSPERYDITREDVKWVLKAGESIGGSRSIKYPRKVRFSDDIQTLGSDGMNSRMGGKYSDDINTRMGRKHSDNRNRRISRKHSDNRNRRMGGKHSDDMNSRRSSKHYDDMNSRRSSKHYDDMNSRLGRKHSDDMDSRMGGKHSDDMNSRMSRKHYDDMNSRLGRKHSDDMDSRMGRKYSYDMNGRKDRKHSLHPTEKYSSYTERASTCSRRGYRKREPGRKDWNRVQNHGKQHLEHGVCYYEKDSFHEWYYGQEDERHAEKDKRIPYNRRYTADINHYREEQRGIEYPPKPHKSSEWYVKEPPHLRNDDNKFNFLAKRKRINNFQNSVRRLDGIMERR